MLRLASFRRDSSLLLLAALAGVLSLSPALAADKHDDKKKAVDDHMAEAKKPSPLDPLKALAGTWVRKGDDGKETIALEIKVTAGGSVVHETMFPGSEHEMINTYHMDSGKVVVTHYCAIGNQPRMECAAPEKNKLVFTFRDITNLKDTSKGMYMGALTVTIKDNDHITHEWTHFQDGKASEEKVSFEYTRKKA